MARPKTTRLSEDITAPQPTDPGDAPADTWDEGELATSVRPDKAAAAAEGHLTVNAVVPAGRVPDRTPTGTRTETATFYGPDGVTPIEVTHNYDTGQTEVPEEPPAGGDEGGDGGAE